MVRVPCSVLWRRVYRWLAVSLLVPPGLLGCRGADSQAARCNPALPQEATWHNPAYPGARGTQPIPGLNGVTFETTDSPATVLAFYTGTLEAVGWAPDTASTPNLNSARFSVANCCKYGWVDVSISPGQPGRTQVTVDYGWGIGCG